MFIPKIFDGSTNTVAFAPDTLTREAEHRDWYARRQGNVGSHYSITGFWISKATNTKGALVYGTIYTTIHGVDEDTFTYQDFLDKARIIKDGPTPQTVSFEAFLLLGQYSLWSSGGGQEIVDELVQLATTYKNLPDVPEGFDGWYSLTSRA